MLNAQGDDNTINETMPETLNQKNDVERLQTSVPPNLIILLNTRRFGECPNVNTG
jgi:hypothetical protein